MHIGIVGATGQVGRVMRSVLAERQLPVDSLRLFASSRSAGRLLPWGDTEIEVEDAATADYDGLDVALFSAGKTTSLELAPRVAEQATVVDNSSAWRMDPEVPLVVPEVNAHALRTIPKGIVANPNCTTIIMLAAVAPLHREVGIHRIVAATYQAASGAGQAAMEELEAGTRAYLAGEPFEPSVLPYPYAFNLFPHNSPLGDDGYCEEERKMVQETAKITGDKKVLEQLASTLVHFTPDFEMMPGTRSPAPRQDLNDYEVGPVEFRGE